jgi:NADPH2:quinone reductase
MCAPGGSYAEFALAWDWTTFHLPISTSFEGKLLCRTLSLNSWLTSSAEASTIPLASLTAMVALFRHLQLPTPWSPATTSIPLIIYGGSTSVGAFAIKLAQNSDIHPIIAIAGNGLKYVETLLDSSKGDVVFNHRDGSDEMIRKIRAHLKAGNYPQLKHGLDPGIGEPSQKVLTEIVAKDGAINLVAPSDWDTGSIARTVTSVGTVHNQDDGAYGRENSDLGLVTCRWFSRALQAGTFKGHPFEVKPGGLAAVEQALKDLKDGKNSAVKYVFRIADTPGL